MVCEGVFGDHQEATTQDNEEEGETELLLLKEAATTEKEIASTHTQRINTSPIVAALLYASCSASMNFANKAVFIGFNFQATTLFFQMIFTIVVLRTLRYFSIVNFDDYNSDLAKKLALPSLMYCINIVCSLMSLGSLSIPVYQVLKRLTPVVCLILAYFILGKRPSLSVIASISLIAIGTVVMGFGDLIYDASGYALGMGSVVSQSLYLTYVQQQGIQLDMMTILYVNSINCLPILIFIMSCIGEYQRLLTFDGWNDPYLYISLGLLLAVGGLLNYSLFLCTVVNSAVLTTVVGVIKAVFTTIIGFYTFGGQPLTALLVIGVVLNTTGAIIYSVLAFLKKRQEKSKDIVNDAQKYDATHDQEIQNPDEET